MAKGAKRSAIIEAATRLFLQEGFAGTSVDRIARDAEVSKPTIYSHFSDKRALFEAAIAHAIDEQVSAWTPPDLGAGQPRRQLSRLARHCVDSWSGDQTVALMRLVIAEGTRFPGIGRNVQARLWLPLGIEVARFLQQWRAARMGQAAARAAARDLVSTLKNETLWPRLLGLQKPLTEKQRRAAAESAVEAFLWRHEP